ncbi:phosphotransferase family protein [Myceligenerans crystallogenes]|uniref:Phosphotransferase family protein n=1 Tax=Myceligenerans crystallogenes TaxID=316335 RepID=A0ABN2N6C3_9MICO
MNDDATPGLDVAGFGRWLGRAHPELLDGTTADAAAPGAGLTASLITGGRSNLTYRVDGARVPLVVRRPPLGHVLATAHDMRREHRVISALAGRVPVPGTVDVVDDTPGDDGSGGDVTGTVFLVMEHVPGEVLARPAQNSRYTPAGLHRLGLDLAEVLADLHAVDPAAVGLADFGRPAGYLDRQMATWRRQYDASRSREVPALDRLQDVLAGSVPAADGGRVGIVHGDYRLDNVIVAGDGEGAGDAGAGIAPVDAGTAPGATGSTGGPRVAAVLDWEMATLGDPLVDLGMLGMYWRIRELAPQGVVAGAIVPGAGYPEFAEVVDAYASRAGIGVPGLGWYEAFACYKLAVILEGVHYRHRAGQTVGDGFDGIGDLVTPLAREGLARTGPAAEGND